MSKDALTARKSLTKSKKSAPPTSKKSSGKLHPLLQNSVERLSKPKGKSFDETWLDATSSTNLQQDSRESLRSVRRETSELIHEWEDIAQDSQYSLTRVQSIEDFAVRNSLAKANSLIQTVLSNASVPSTSALPHVSAKTSSRKSVTDNANTLLRHSATVLAPPPKKSSAKPTQVEPRKSSDRSVTENASKLVNESAAALAKVSSKKSVAAKKSSGKSVIEHANKLLRDSIAALAQSSSKFLEEPSNPVAQSTTTVVEANSILNAVLSEIERTDSSYLLPYASEDEIGAKTSQVVSRERSTEKIHEPAVASSIKSLPSKKTSEEAPKRRSLAQVASSRESTGKLAKFLQDSVHRLSQPKRDYSTERIDSKQELPDPRQPLTTPRSDHSLHEKVQKRSVPQESAHQLSQSKRDQSSVREGSKQEFSATRQPQTTPRSDPSLREKTQNRAVSQESPHRLPQPEREHSAEREPSQEEIPFSHQPQTAARRDPSLHEKTQKRSTPLVPSTKPSADDASKPPTARSDVVEPAPTFTSKGIQAPSSRNKAPPKEQSFESSIPETKNKIPLPPPRTQANAFRQSTVEDRLLKTGPMLSDEATCFYKVDADGTEQVPRSMLSCTRYPLPSAYVPPAAQKEPVASSSSQNIIMAPRPKKVVVPLKKPGKKQPPKKGPVVPVVPSKPAATKASLLTRSSQTKFKAVNSQESTLSQLKEKADEIVEEAVEEADHELDEDEEPLQSLTDFYQEAETHLAEMASEDAASDVLDRTASSNTRLTRSATSHRSPTYSKSQRRRHSTEGCAPLYLVPPVRMPGAARGKVCGDCLYGYQDEPNVYWDPTRALPSVGLGEPLIPPYRGNLEFDNRTGPAAQYILPYNILLDEQAAKFLESPLVRRLLRQQKLINPDCMVNVPLKEYTQWQRELSRLQRELFNSVRKRRELEGLFGELMSLVGGTGDEEDLFRDLAKVGKLDYEELQHYLMVRVMQKQEWLTSLRDNRSRLIRATNNQYARHMFQHRRQQFLWDYEEKEAIRLERYSAQQRANKEERERHRQLQFERVNQRRLRQMREDDSRRREIQEKMLDKAQRRHERYIEFQEQSLPKELESPRYVIGQRPYRATREPSDKFLDVIAQALKPMPPLRKGEKRGRGRLPHIMANANEFKKPWDSRTAIESPVPPRPLARMSMHRADEKQGEMRQITSATSSGRSQNYDEEENEDLHTSEGVLDVPSYISHTIDEGSDADLHEGPSYTMDPSHGQDSSRSASRHQHEGNHDHDGHYISRVQPGHKGPSSSDLPGTPHKHHHSPHADHSGPHISHIPHTAHTPLPTPRRHKKSRRDDGHDSSRVTPTHASPSRHDLHASRAVMDVPSYVMDPSHGQDPSRAVSHTNPRRDLHSVPSLMDVPSRADLPTLEQTKSSSKHHQENTPDGHHISQHGQVTPHSVSGHHLDPSHNLPRGRSKSPLQEAYADHHYTISDVTPSYGRYRDQVLGIPSMVDSLEIPRHKSRTKQKPGKPKETTSRHRPERGHSPQVKHGPDGHDNHEHGPGRRDEHGHSPGRREPKPGHSPVSSDHLISRVLPGAHSTHPSREHLDGDPSDINLHHLSPHKITITTPSVESHVDHSARPSPLLDAADALFQDILGEMGGFNPIDVASSQSLHKSPVSTSSSSSSKRGWTSSAHHKPNIHEALSEIVTAGQHLQLFPEIYHVKNAKSDQNLHPTVSQQGVKQAKSTSHLQQRKKSEDDGFLHPHHNPHAVPSSQSNHSLRGASSHLSALSGASSSHDVAGALLDDLLDLYVDDHHEEPPGKSPARSQGKHSPHRQLPTDPNSEEHKEAVELLEALLEQYTDKHPTEDRKSSSKAKSRQDLLKPTNTHEPRKTTWPQEKVDVAVSVHAVKSHGAYANFQEEPTSHLAHAVHEADIPRSHDSDVLHDKVEVEVSPSNSVEEAEEMVRRITLEAEDEFERWEEIHAYDITNGIWDDAHEIHDQLGLLEDQSAHSHIHPSHGLHYPHVIGSSHDGLQFDNKEEASSMSNYALHHPESDMSLSATSSQFPLGASSTDLPASASVRHFAEDVVEEAVEDAEMRDYPSTSSNLDLASSNNDLLDVASKETIRWPYKVPTNNPLIPVASLLPGEQKVPSGFTPLELSMSKILDAHPHVLRGETERPLYGLPPPPKTWRGGNYDYDGGKSHGHEPHVVSRGPHAHTSSAMIETIAQPSEGSSRFASPSGFDQSNHSIRPSSSRSVSPSGYDRRSPSPSGYDQEAHEGPAKTYIRPHASRSMTSREDFSTGVSTVDLRDQQSRQNLAMHSRSASAGPSQQSTPITSRQASPTYSRQASPAPSREAFPPSRPVSPVPSRQASTNPSRQASPVTSRQASPISSRANSPVSSRQPSPTPSRSEFRQDRFEVSNPTGSATPSRQTSLTRSPTHSRIPSPAQSSMPPPTGSPARSLGPSPIQSPAISPAPSRNQSPSRSPAPSPEDDPSQSRGLSPANSPRYLSPNHSPAHSRAVSPAPSRTPSPTHIPPSSPQNGPPQSRGGSPSNSPRNLSPNQSRVPSPTGSRAPSAGPSPTNSPTTSTAPSRTPSPVRNSPPSPGDRPPENREMSPANSAYGLSPSQSPTRHPMHSPAGSPVHSVVPSPTHTPAQSRTPSPTRNSPPYPEDVSPQSRNVSPANSMRGLSPNQSPTRSQGPSPAISPVPSARPSPTHTPVQSRTPSPTQSYVPSPTGTPGPSVTPSPTRSPAITPTPSRTGSPSQSPPRSPPQSRGLSPANSAMGLSPGQSPTRSATTLSPKHSPKASPRPVSPVDSSHRVPHYTPSGLVRLTEEDLAALNESDSEVGLEAPHDTNQAAPSTEYIAHSTRRSKIHFSVDKTNVGDQTIRHYSKTDGHSPTRHDQQAMLQQEELPPSVSMEDTRTRWHENNEVRNSVPDEEIVYEERPSALTADIIKAAQFVDDDTRPSSLVGNEAEETRAVVPGTARTLAHSPERSPRRRTNEYLASHDNEQIRRDSESMRGEIFKQRVVKAASSEELHRVRPTTSEEHHHTNSNLHRSSSTNMHVHSVPSEESSYRSSMGHSEPTSDVSQESRRDPKPQSLSRPSLATTMDHHRTGTDVMNHLEKHLATTAISGMTEAVPSATSLVPSAVSSTESCDPDHPDSYQQAPPKTVVIEVTSVQSDTSNIIADYTNRRHHDPSGMLTPVPARSPAGSSEHSSSAGSSQQSGSSASGSSVARSELSVLSNKSTYGNSTDSVSEVGSDTDASSYDNMSSLAPSSEGTNTSDRRTGRRSDEQSLPSSQPLESISDQPSQETINYGSSPSRQSNVESVMDSISIQDMHTSPLSLHHGPLVPDRTLPRIPSESKAETSSEHEQG